MTTPTPGTAGDPQRPEPAGSDPTREIEVGQPTQEQPTHEQPTHEQPMQEQPRTEPVPEVSAVGAHPAAEQHTADWLTAEAPGAEPLAREEPRRPSGPHLPPVLLGIVCLAIAGLAIWQEVTDVQVDWGNVGPLGIVAIGALLVLLGLVGLLGSRRHRSS